MPGIASCCCPSTPTGSGGAALLVLGVRLTFTDGTQGTIDLVDERLHGHPASAAGTLAIDLPRISGKLGRG